jgi:hypothetical protein
MNHFIGYREANNNGDVFSQTPIPECLSGNTELIQELMTSNICPKTKDLRND